MVLLMWLDLFPEDFREAPSYPTLQQLKNFATKYFPETDITQRAKNKMDTFKLDEDRYYPGKKN